MGTAGRSTLVVTGKGGIPFRFQNVRKEGRIGGIEKYAGPLKGFFDLLG